jgi:phosphohistidine phosphatase
MKTLILVRHAKSSWKDQTLADYDRPLNKRGKRNAPEMGQRLAERGIRPDRMVSSPAKRAIATAQAVAKEVGFPREKIVEDERLYLSSVSTWLEVIRPLDDDADCVICFGHNPELTDLVNTLGRQDIGNMPTCGVVELRYDIETWADVGKVEPTYFDFDYPKKGQ